MRDEASEILSLHTCELSQGVEDLFAGSTESAVQVTWGEIKSKSKMFSTRSKITDFVMEKNFYKYGIFPQNFLPLSCSIEKQMSATLLVSKGVQQLTPFVQ